MNNTKLNIDSSCLIKNQLIASIKGVKGTWKTSIPKMYQKKTDFLKFNIFSELKISIKYKQHKINTNKTPIAKLYVNERFMSSLKYNMFKKKETINRIRKITAKILLLILVNKALKSKI